jgi:septal ring factor EnvC (AmiA/AmiB activator)
VNTPATPGPDAFQMTLLQTLMEVKSDVATIKTKVENVENNLKSIDDCIKDHDKRLDELEAQLSTIGTHRRIFTAALAFIWSVLLLFSENIKALIGL